jgi:hypothetical protein
MLASRYNTVHCNRSHVLGYNLFKSTDNFGTEQGYLKVLNRLNGTLTVGTIGTIVGYKTWRGSLLNCVARHSSSSLRTA